MIRIQIIFLIFIASSPLFGQQEDQSDDCESQTWAGGLNLAWLNRKDFGAREFRRFSPEIVGYRYGATPWLYTCWRAGLRLGYASAQPEMPQAVQVVETDTTFSAEGSIIREWYLVPSLTWGIGYDFRTIKVKTANPIESADSRLNKKQRLMMWYTQAGLGLPIYNGQFLIEPIIRYQKIEYDDRSTYLFGFETSYGF